MTLVALDDLVRRETLSRSLHVLGRTSFTEIVNRVVPIADPKRLNAVFKTRGSVTFFGGKRLDSTFKSCSVVVISLPFRCLFYECLII